MNSAGCCMTGLCAVGNKNGAQDGFNRITFNADASGCKLPLSKDGE